MQNTYSFTYEQIRKAVNRRFLTKLLKNVLDVVSKLVKNVLPSIEYKLNEVDKLGEKIKC
ncbi:hypothetical protein HYD88_00855 [Mycoplasmopsis bovis]|nr:hypothetical protein [Mycoplasmopsis bovis]QQH36343.1 hypothetical protein HYD88_00855 [Mycoplasmopsis bovis]